MYSSSTRLPQPAKVAVLPFASARLTGCYLISDIPLAPVLLFLPTIQMTLNFHLTCNHIICHLKPIDLKTTTVSVLIPSEKREIFGESWLEIDCFWNLEYGRWQQVCLHYFNLFIFTMIAS